MNYIDLTNGFTPSEISAFGMPSTTYEELTVEPSPADYTAPANGYYFVNMSSGTYARLTNLDYPYMAGVTPNVPNIGGLAYLPIRKGDKMRFTYDGTILRLVFIYAEGEV